MNRGPCDSTCRLAADVGELRAKTFPFGPSCVHPKEHRRPVLRVVAPCPRRDDHSTALLVVWPREEQLELFVLNVLSESYHAQLGILVL